MSDLELARGADAQPKDFEALGRFIARYSTLEIALHFALKSLLRIDDEIERMLVREARLTDLFEFLKKAAALRELDALATATLKAIITDIQYLNRVRAIVAHKPFMMTTDGTMIFHDMVTAATLDASFGYPCTAQQLEAAGHLASQVALVLIEFMDHPSDKTHAAMSEIHASSGKLQLPGDPARMREQTAKSKAQPRSSQA